MLVGRLNGGTPSTSTPSILTRPSVGSSKPATIRGVVVLPQPLGPSGVKNTRRDDQVDDPDRRDAAEPLRDALQLDARASELAAFVRIGAHLTA